MIHLQDLNLQLSNKINKNKIISSTNLSNNKDNYITYSN